MNLRAHGFEQIDIAIDAKVANAEAGDDRKFCPSNEKALSNSIERLKPLLRRRGIYIEKLKRRAQANVFSIYRKEEAKPNQITFEDAPFSLFESEGGMK